MINNVEKNTQRKIKRGKIKLENRKRVARKFDDIGGEKYKMKPKRERRKEERKVAAKSMTRVFNEK